MNLSSLTLQGLGVAKLFPSYQPFDFDVEVKNAPEWLQQVIQGQDHVVCAIGGNGLDDSTTRTEGTNHIISSMKSMKGIHR